MGIDNRQSTGIGQLSLVEHALCPLDARRGMVANFVHAGRYRFSDAGGRRRTAQVRVFCPLGLSPGDELYLWGLLALTLAQTDAVGELRATPHWCLRRLGIVDAGGRRGGRQYVQFAAALRRLSTVTYLNDAFYDPLRCEHRAVSFGLLSYSLPSSDDSGRAWRILWNPLFFEFAAAAAGALRFDWKLYCTLDPAARRLLLFLGKLLHRGDRLPELGLYGMAVDLLGFSEELTAADQKRKVQGVLAKLMQAGVLEQGEVIRMGKGDFRVKMVAGRRLEQSKPSVSGSSAAEDSPQFAGLIELGFEPGAARRLVREVPPLLLAEWIDITQAARERFGMGFFKKSPMAFLVDSVRHAQRGQRTPPDWWHELRQREAGRGGGVDTDSAKLLVRLQRELFGDAVGEREETDAPRAARSTTGMASAAEVLRRRH